MACIFARRNRPGNTGEDRAGGGNDARFTAAADNVALTGRNNNRADARSDFAARNGFVGNAMRSGRRFDLCGDSGTAAAAQAAEIAACARNEQQCIPPNESGTCRFAAISPVGDYFYGDTETVTVCTTCCDPLCGCKAYNIANRDPFWPVFAHPRWLPCCQLYLDSRADDPVRQLETRDGFPAAGNARRRADRAFDDDRQGSRPRGRPQGNYRVASKSERF